MNVNYKRRIAITVVIILVVYTFVAAISFCYIAINLIFYGWENKFIYLGGLVVFYTILLVSLMSIEVPKK